MFCNFDTVVFLRAFPHRDHRFHMFPFLTAHQSLSDLIHLMSPLLKLLLQGVGDFFWLPGVYSVLHLPSEEPGSLGLSKLLDEPMLLPRPPIALQQKKSVLESFLDDGRSEI